MDKVSSLAYQLHEMLLQSNEYLSLKEAENIMLNDLETSNLITSYHQALEKYSTNKSIFSVSKDIYSLSSLEVFRILAISSKSEGIREKLDSKFLIEIVILGIEARGKEPFL